MLDTFDALVHDAGIDAVFRTLTAQQTLPVQITLRPPYKTQLKIAIVCRVYLFMAYKPVTIEDTRTYLHFGKRVLADVQVRAQAQAARNVDTAVVLVSGAFGVVERSSRLNVIVSCA